MQLKPLKVIISGGGTGGHIYPAIAIANAIKEKHPDADILFVGAADRMEMQKVPQAGYPIKGLNIAGFQRSLSAKNLTFPFKVVGSLLQAVNIVRAFKPHVAVGVGGYASGPLLFAANTLGVPTLIQEQNSYAGVTNKILARSAKRICVAYPGMEKFFPAGKLLLTGNPVRADIEAVHEHKEEGLVHFDLDPHKPVLLVIGGSLGARTINRAMQAGYERLTHAGYQVIWQTGKAFYPHVAEDGTLLGNKDVRVMEFINRMDLAYAVACVVVSRAGALSISELCLAGKPSILVPSPNVAEDHQTHNARTLTNANAAQLVKDTEAGDKLIDAALALLSNPTMQETLAYNARALAKPCAAIEIADEVLRLAGR